MIYDQQNGKRYQTYAQFLKQKFGGRVSRISLNAGCTCPNLDGTRGRGGCIYCSSTGSGEFGGNPELPIPVQFQQVADRMASKWPTDMHIAYFQARTNTYAPVEVLREWYEQALRCPGVVGLAIATRPDCLPKEVCTLLGELARRTYLVVELGLQSVHEETGRRINRCHSYQEFLQGYETLRAEGVLVGVHLINGLPGESLEEMVESAKQLAKLEIHLLKLHQLCLLRGTVAGKWYQQGKLRPISLEEYVQVVCDQLEAVPQNWVIGRLTGDPEPKALLAPEWSVRKKEVLAAIDRELVRRDSWQGKFCQR